MRVDYIYTFLHVFSYIHRIGLITQLIHSYPLYWPFCGLPYFQTGLSDAVPSRHKFPPPNNPNDKYPIEPQLYRRSLSYSAGGSSYYWEM